MNDSILKIVVGITLICATLFPFERPSNAETENEVTLKTEINLIEAPENLHCVYTEKNRDLIWSSMDMNDDDFPKGLSCNISIN